jgi:predicted DNA binding CopG/RHH family protein
MKKTETPDPAETPGKIVTMTIEDAEKWSGSKEGRESARRSALIRDEHIDFSDIPKKTDFSKGIRLRDLADHPEHPLYRALTQSVTIRLNAPDVLAARQLSEKKGLRYQTYIKMLLHEALQRELAAQ